MKTVASSMQGGTPELAVKPIDPDTPICGRPLDVHAVCTRGKGHYGQCGLKVPPPEAHACN